MPMPFHCQLCDKPVQQALNAICDECKAKKEEEEKRIKNMVSSNNIGEKEGEPEDTNYRR